LRVPLAGAMVHGWTETVPGDARPPARLVSAWRGLIVLAVAAALVYYAVSIYPKA